MEAGRYGSNNGHIFKYMCSLLSYKTRREFLIGGCARCCLWSLRSKFSLLHPSLYFWDKKPINYIAQTFYPAGLLDSPRGRYRWRIRGERKGEAILFPTSEQ